MKWIVAFLVSALGLPVFGAQKLRDAKFPLTFTPEKSLQVTIKLAEGVAVAHLPSGKQQKLSAYDSADVGVEAAPLLTGDFNFDGYQDIAVLEGNGYGGVNLFYRVWLWQNKQQNFREFATSISNPVLNSKSHMVISGQRSGPRWHQTVFAANTGQLLPYAEAQMLDAAGFWGVVFSDGTRTVADAKWFDGDLRKAPKAEAELVAGRCAGLQKQNVKAPTGKKLKVVLLDFRDEGAEVLARFGDGQKPRWISADCLVSE